MNHHASSFSPLLPCGTRWELLHQIPSSECVQQGPDKGRGALERWSRNPQLGSADQRSQDPAPSGSFCVLEALPESCRDCSLSVKEPALRALCRDWSWLCCGRLWPKKKPRVQSCQSLHELPGGCQWPLSKAPVAAQLWGPGERFSTHPLFLCPRTVPMGLW